MTASRDYYANHRLKLRFPWRLYHAPIVDAVARTVRRASGDAILNVGSGPFLEFDVMPQEGRRYTICDVDERAVAHARSRLGSLLAGACVVRDDGPLPFADASFDVVFATEVIEHVSVPDAWLADLLRVLRPGGTLLVTTPNYESWSLCWIERTVLEAIARSQGFSRAAIHPNRFDARSLQRALQRAGATAIDVQTTSLGWVLCATARRASSSEPLP